MTNLLGVDPADASSDRSVLSDIADASAPAPKSGQRSWTFTTALSGGYLLIVAAIAVLAPIIWPHVASQNAADILEANQGPSGNHLLGTDTVGRDVLLRILVGTGPTMLGVVEGLAVVAVLGIPVGVAAGYLQGRVDKTVSWVADIVFSIPAIVVIMSVLAVFRGSMLAAMIAFGVLAAPGLMRVVRAATLQVREELYIAAAQVAGLSRFYILTRHVLPRIRGTLAVQLSLLASLALLVQTGLAFLGLLIAPPAPSWGGMVAEGTSVLALNPWLIWPSGAVIALTVLAFGFLSDSIRTRTGRQAAVVKRPGRRRPHGGAPDAMPSPEPGKEPSKPSVTSADDALVRIRGLRVSAVTHAGTTRIVDSVTLSIRPGETVGLVGESGCGKSVTAAALTGVLPANMFVEAGTIEFEGVDLTRLNQRALRSVQGRKIGLIGQEPMIGLNPAMRIGAQLAELVRLHHGCRRAEARRRVVELLGSVRLRDPESVARKYPHELSGGMAQRVAIARALAGEPELLIADEPTTALDVTVQAEILDLLRETQQQRGMAILLITHDWGVVAELCERAVVMYAGQVIESAPVEAILTQPQHPYTGLLLSSDPHHSRGVDMLPTIPGLVPPPGSWPVGCRFADRCPRAEQDCTAGPISVGQVDDSLVRCIHPLSGAKS